MGESARGEDGAKYPWGNDEPDCALTNRQAAAKRLRGSSVSDGASPYGLLDMAGNMVGTSPIGTATYYETSPTTDPQGPESGTRFGGRGGGFRSDAEYQRASKRDYYDPPDQGATLGFRCAR